MRANVDAGPAQQCHGVQAVVEVHARQGWPQDQNDTTAQWDEGIHSKTHLLASCSNVS